MNIYKKLLNSILLLIGAAAIYTGSLYGLYKQEETKVHHAEAESGKKPAVATKNKGVYAQEGARQADKMQQIFGLRADIASEQLKEFEASDEVKNVGYEVLAGIRRFYKERQEGAAHPKGAFTTPTKNKYGDSVFFKSYLITKMLEDVAAAQKKKDKELTFLDIGAGIGSNTELLLDAGVTVVANDLSAIHLAQLKYKLDMRENKSHLFKRLYLNDGHLDSLNFPDNSFDGVLISHVFHYLTPQEITSLLPKLFRWLKPGGRLYIQAFNIKFEDFSWYQPTYEENIKAGVQWPGFIENAHEQAKKTLETLIENESRETMKEYYRKLLEEFIEGFPHTVHAHDLKTLSNALTQAQFKIIDVREASFMRESGEYDDAMNDTIMLIAEPKKGVIS